MLVSFALQVDYAAGVVHKNIVQLLDVFTEGQRYVIVVRHTTPRSGSDTTGCTRVAPTSAPQSMFALSFLQSVLSQHTPQVPNPRFPEIPQAALMLLQWELVNGPDLLDLINIAHDKKLPEPTVAHYFQQLINAVIFMHNNGFCHRDLKAENCVVDTASQRVKVGCFISVACTICITSLICPKLTVSHYYH